MIKLPFGFVPVAMLLASTTLPCCGTPAFVETALHGDIASLKAEIETAQMRGELDGDSTRALARAVAARLVVSANDPYGPSLIASAGDCRERLSDALRQRAEQTDATAAAALTELFEDGRVDAATLVSTYRDSPDPEWLAVAARAAIGPELSSWRAVLMRSPHEHVRRAVLRAALDARTPADIPELLEASRLDPDPVSRSFALRALAAIGTERTIQALSDRWRSAHQDDRLEIVEAWALSPTFERGGRKMLERAALGRGLPSVAATLALLKHRTDAPPWAEDTLAQMIDSRPETEQLEAMGAADPNHGPTRQALLRARKGASAAVRVEALGVLLRHPKHAKMATTALRKTANGTNEAAFRARSLLAEAGDRTILPLLEKQLTSTRHQQRLSAALALMKLGLPERAAPILADVSQRARFAVACSLMTSSQ